jgi:hypothetical protein
MPLFYFHLWSHQQYIVDPEGSEHGNVDAARTEALFAARSIMSEEIKSGRFDLDQKFELHDDRGHHLLTIPFAHALETVEPGAVASSIAAKS